MRVFIVDTLPTLGYTLAGFHGVRTSTHTGNPNQPGCVYTRRVRQHIDLLYPLAPRRFTDGKINDEIADCRLPRRESRHHEEGSGSDP